MSSTPVITFRDGLFWLDQSFVYRMPWDRSQYVVIPLGYATNFASVPWIARIIVSPIDPDIVIASLIHDFLVGEFHNTSGIRVIPVIFLEFESKENDYNRRKTVNWDGAAWYMREIMKHEGAPRWKRFVVYSGVRLYGWLSGRSRK